MKADILLVDDEKSIRKALGMVLKSHYGVMAAKSGAEALVLFQKNRPELVILDIGLQDMDGIEVLKTLKKSDSAVMVIMLTACNDAK